VSRRQRGEGGDALIVNVTVNWRILCGCVVTQLIQGHRELRYYKSGFFKLATNFYGLSEPISPQKHQVQTTVSNRLCPCNYHMCDSWM